MSTNGHSKPESIHNLADLADEARTMGERLGGIDQEFLETIATHLDRAHDALATLPTVVQRAQLMASCQAFIGAADICDKLCDDIEKGVKAPLRTVSALRQLAFGFRQSVEKNRPPADSMIEKRGFLL